jgi:putative ABC transport system permease protein
MITLVSLVLVVACANLANLNFARSALRQREFATRRALGASRWRVVRVQCVESTILAALGGAVALVVSRTLVWLLLELAPLSYDIRISIDPELSTEAVVAAAAALLVCLFLFGIEPALQVTRRQSVSADLVGDYTSVGVLRPWRQRTLIRWQVAISVCFFLIVALFVRFLAIEAQSEHSVPLDRFAVTALDFGALGWDESRARVALQRVIEVTKHTPGNLGVAAYSGLGPRVPVASVAPMPSGSRNFMYMLAATPDLFDTLGVPIILGRRFAELDDRQAALVVVISEQTARHLYGTPNVLGRQISFQSGKDRSPQNATVIGVSRDTDCGDLFRHNDDILFVPLAQHYEPGVTVVSKTSRDSESMLRQLRAAIRQVDPEMSTVAAGTGPLVLGQRYLAARFVALVAGSLGGLTLLLGMIGLYGVQSEGVSRRTREFGVRLAIGASAGRIGRMVLVDGFQPVLQGLLLGFFFGTVARLIVRVVLEAPIRVLEPVSFGLVPLPFLVAAFLACYLPARRAACTDPNVSLRHL